MGCKTVYDAGGITVISCSRGQNRKRCSVTGCTNPALVLCDYSVKTKSGRCDRDLCVRCAVSQPGGKEYCPPHDRFARETNQINQKEPTR